MAKYKTTQYHGMDTVEEKLHDNEEKAHAHAKKVLKPYKGKIHQDYFYDHGNPVIAYNVEDENGDSPASVHVEEHRGGGFAFRKN